MFDPSVWGWPQWTGLVLMFLGLCVSSAMHGKDKAPEKYNGFVALTRFALWAFLLIFGGFFA